MKAPRGTVEKHLIFESHIKKGVAKKSPLLSANDIWFWSDRLAIVQCERADQEIGFHKFIAFDLLTHEPRPIHLGKSGYCAFVRDFYPLNNEVGIITESSFIAICCHMNFVKLNWNTNEFELIEHFEKECGHLDIIVDKMNPSKFALHWSRLFGDFQNYQICSLNKGKIEFGEIFQLEHWFNFYHDDKFIRAHQSGIKIYDLKLKREQSVQIDKSLLPENVEFLKDVRELVNDRLYFAIEFQNTKSYGIAWADLNEKCWKLMGFETNLMIRKLEFLNGNFIVSATTYYIIDHKIYSISIKRPQSLRKSAWLLVVKCMKNIGEKNPYNAAKEYLPLNSDLREYWFKDKEEEEEEEEEENEEEDEEEDESNNELGILEMFINLLSWIFYGKSA